MMGMFPLALGALIGVVIGIFIATELAPKCDIPPAMAQTSKVRHHR